ncbi:MAG: tRNA dihydrouridine(20/20a) synthase DusA [Hyphomicrobiales bacterium]|nr:tRNA dihydrouridine(20/20a) synthase DusA [Hyphomicrobiales bacterium]
MRYTIERILSRQASSQMKDAAAFRFSVAPMMEWTDRFCRLFHRALTREARLYTEMVAAAALVHGPREKLLAFDPQEHPLALQIGGAQPSELSLAARFAEDAGYREINLNVGCPSDRVQNARFGACLMREPNLVGDCVAAMKAQVAIPVTVKCRLGIDEQDTEEALDRLADATVAAGVDALIVHARKAWLEGLSPKENRHIPPLDYPRVYRLKARLPSVPIAINGGISTLAEAKAHLAHLDGVMLGRAAYQNPGLLIEVDWEIFGKEPPVADGMAAARAMRPHLERLLASGIPAHRLTRHMLGLFQGVPGARAYRRILASEARRPGAGPEVLDAALARLSRVEEKLPRDKAA